jgi:hypothetical protein
MSERPILFSAPMVRAILEGRKTQTRRLCKEMNKWVQQDCREVRVVNGRPWHALIGAERPMYELARPYGSVGDRLWVRETWAMNPTRDFGVRKARGPQDCVYRADRTANAAPAMAWTPSIHMPRAASRITLEVTGVRVERLQDISEADAAAEGVESLDSSAHEEREKFDPGLCTNCGGFRLYDAIGPNMGVMPDTDCRDCDTHVKRYRWLWESINGADSWAANPWVWVVEFPRVTA